MWTWIGRLGSVCTIVGFSWTGYHLILALKTDAIRTIDPPTLGPAEYFALTVGGVVVLGWLNLPALKWLASYPGRRQKRKKEKESSERQRIINVMRETASLIDIYFFRSPQRYRSQPKTEESLARIEVNMEELTKLGLVSDQEVSREKVAAHLSSLIPYVEKYGIKRACEVTRSRYGEQEESTKEGGPS